MTLIMLYVTKKMSKEKFLFFANIYTKVKIFMNILLAGIVARFLYVKIPIWSWGKMRLLALVFFVIISTIDSYLIFRRIKKLRQLSISDVEYLWNYVRNTIIMLGLFLIVAQLKYFVKDAEDYIFLGTCVISVWAYQYIMPYIMKATNKTRAIEMNNIKEVLLKTSGIQNKFKIYSYEGKSNKSANAVVVGTCINRHIFISDYFIENTSEEEVVAILCHECGHIKNCDLEKRIIFADIAMILFFILTCVMDLLKIGFVGGSILLLVLFGLGLYIYIMMQQKQELRADRFAVSVIGNEEMFISALIKLYEMNDMLKKNNKFFELLSTHPQLQVRIDNLCDK